MENNLSLDQQRAMAMAQARKRKVLAETNTPSSDNGYIPEKPGLEDYARTGLDQSMQGATFGFSDEISDRIGAMIASKVTGIPYSELLKEARSTTKDRLAEQFQEMPVTSIVSNLAGGLATGGVGATTKAGTAIGNSLRTGSAPARIAKGIVAGAASGGLVGAGTAQDDQRIQGARQGAIFGGSVGAAVPAVAAAGSKLKQAVIPEIDEGISLLAQRAKDFGIPLSADQLSPTRARKTVQKISQEIPFSGVDKFEQNQRRAFTKALSRTIGQDSEDLGPSTVRKFLSDAKSKFDGVLKGETVRFSPDDVKILDQIAVNADETIDPGLASIVKKNINNLKKSLSKGQISGELLSSTRSELIKKSTRTQGGAKPYLQDLIEFLDDNIEKSLSPEKSSLLKQTRREWRNFKTIQPLLKKSTDGTVNPTELINKVNSSKYIDSSKSALGDDDLIDLARIGKEFLPKSGGSDTFQKTVFGTGAAGIGLTALANPPLALAVGTKAAAGLGANRAYQGYNTSQKVIDLILKQNKQKRIGDLSKKMQEKIK